MGETTQVTGAAQPDEDIQQMLRAEIATLNADTVSYTHLTLPTTPYV